MPRIARCDMCNKEKEMPLVFLGSSMPDDWQLIRCGVHRGAVFCDKCYDRYVNMLNKKVVKESGRT